MEAIGALIVVAIVWIGFSLVLRAGVGTIRAAARTAMGKGSFSDNFQAAVVGMGPIEARLIDEPQEAGGLKVKELQVKGVFPINRRRRLAFVTSLFDKTGGDFEPVISGLEMFQEAQTFAFQHRSEVGFIDQGVGFISWVRVGVVISEIIEPPYAGARDLVAILRLIDLDNEPDITRGFHEADHAGLVWQVSLPFKHFAASKGYLEAADLRDRARACCIKIAMAIAMWDGSLSDQEGEILKSWIQRVLTGFAGARRENLKNALNGAMKEAYEASRSGDLSLLPLTEELNEIDDNVIKYETIDLCFELLAISQINGSDKARVIDLIARALNLDLKELERIRDTKIIGLNSELSGQVRVEDLLGIDSEWDVERIKKHLRAEFQKWNNRISALPEGEERDNAQRMLDAIAEARRKYA